MSWLERARRRDVDRTAATDVLDKEEPAAPRFIDQAAIDYFDADGERRGWLRRARGFILKPWPSLILFVILPSLAVIYYYGVAAADQYVVQARFVVRQVEDTSFAKGTMKLGGDESQSSNKAGESGATSNSGTSSSGSRKSSITTDDQDAYVVASYIGSPAILGSVAKDLNPRDLFQRPEADFWARLGDSASKEDLERYWLRMVNAYVDRSSGIVTLEVRAFRREDALMLADTIIASSSRLVNDMSLRARDDALTRAKAEVERANGAMRAVMTDMEMFQNREGLIDPLNTATNTSEVLKQLLGRRIATDTELYVTQQMRPDAPTIPTLKEQLKALDDRIADLRSTLTAKGAPATDVRAISATLVGFDELAVKEKLATALYVNARIAADNARQSAEKRWLYLAVFVPPTLPDDSEYPDRLAFPAIGVVVLFALWAIAALIWASVLDHRA
jgi:capsular polysaccharide transport system permease protein